MKDSGKLLAILAGVGMMAISGCKSHWVDATVENATGQVIQQLEVNYPTASFGINTLASGASMHYRFQVRGSGPVKVEYLLPDGKSEHGQGLTLGEHDEGQLAIRLLPVGKFEFLPKLQSSMKSVSK